MLEHKIKRLKDCEAVSDIIVSPDSDKMLKMAEAQGVEAWKRTKKYNLDEVPFGEPVEYICKQLSSSHVLWACCASPLWRAFRSEIPRYEATDRFLLLERQ